MVATNNRVLVITMESELILLDPNAKKFEPLGRVKVFDDEGGQYSHPAFVGPRMYIRSSSALVCVDFKDPTP
jgi:outer membrane protein assembly factor BamB